MKPLPTKEVLLNTPVTIDGVSVDRLTMREPQVSDMYAAKRAKTKPEDIEIMLFANLCEVAQETIMALSMRDYGRLQKAFQEFTDDENAPEGGSPLD